MNELKLIIPLFHKSNQCLDHPTNSIKHISKVEKTI